MSFLPPLSHKKKNKNEKKMIELFLIPLIKKL